MKTKHTCHAHDCAREVPPQMLMCLMHWRIVPKHLKDAVNAAYRPGQWAGKTRPSIEWLKAARAAIQSIVV